MYLNPMELPPGGPAARLACAILAAQTKRIDRVNNEVADELVRYERSRELLDSLIDRLIGERDELDLAAGLDDFEDDDDELDWDVADAPHDDDDPAEPSLGARESAWPTRVPGTAWFGEPTPARHDECEVVSEDEGAACDDEGFDQDDDRGAHEGV